MTLPALPTTCVPIDTTLCDGFDDLNPEVQDYAIALAGLTLRMLTGYKIAGCPVKVRPCSRRCDSNWYEAGGPFYPHVVDGEWVNSCYCMGSCSCGALCEVSLPGPIAEITEIKIDGTVLDNSEYVVMDGDKVVYIGTGDCPWPSCQNLALPDTEPGTFSITYSRGVLVDGLGARAAGLLACEFAKAYSGGQCRLPSNVTSVIRDGVSFDLTQDTFAGGLTGIQLVDLYTQSINPNRLKQPPTVWTPNAQQASQTTWSA